MCRGPPKWWVSSQFRFKTTHDNYRVTGSRNPLQPEASRMLPLRHDPHDSEVQARAGAREPAQRLAEGTSLHPVFSWEGAAKTGSPDV